MRTKVELDFEKNESNKIICTCGNVQAWPMDFSAFNMDTGRTDGDFTCPKCGQRYYMQITEIMAVSTEDAKRQNEKSITKIDADHNLVYIICPHCGNIMDSPLDSIDTPETCIKCEKQFKFVLMTA